MLLLFVAAAKRAPSLQVSIDREIAGSKRFASAFLGMHVVRLKDGKVLYAHNEDHLFTPASNVKLFTTALALTRLGPDYRFITSIVSEKPVGGDGVLDGDLIFIGRGDPSLSQRPYPYVKDWIPDPQIKPIEALADQLAAGGLKAVHGDIVGDDTRYPWTPYPAGWSVDDGLWEYGAPVSALIVGDNRVDVTIGPGDSEGDLAHLTVSPSFEFFSVDNRVQTIASGRREIHVDGRPGVPQLRFWGSIPIGSDVMVNAMAVADPAVYAAAILRDALIRRGITVNGDAVARHRFPGEPAIQPAGIELVRRMSPPLSQLLQVVDKVSQNLHAEVMLREVGAFKAKAGLEELRDFLTEAGVPEDQYKFVDGSGLSRNTLVSPQAITKLLEHMYGSPQRDAWIAMLPVGNEDGTLRRRFKGHPEAAGIHAKTGSLSHVRALSGYAESKRQGMVAFSLLLNDYLAPDAEVARFLDNIGLKLLP